MIACPSCKQNNEPHFKFCLGCGGELPSSAAMPMPTTSGWLDEEPATLDGGHAAIGAVVTTAPRPEPTPAAETRACPSCGTVSAAGLTFCGQCGARLAAAPTLPDIGSGTITEGQLVLVRADGTEGGRHSLSIGTNLIGRGLGPLFDADGYLSPKHAEVTLGPDGVVVSDAGSLNGVFLRMTEEEELQHNDVFRVGQELLRFEVLPPTEPLADGTHIMGSPQGNAWGRLVLVVSPQGDGPAYALAGDSIILGRERGDVLFPEDGYVSGTHASVSNRDGRCVLTDLNSSNGTFVRLRGPRAVPSGALLLMGQQLFRVTYG